jgi:hypothetical protein
VIRYGVGVTRRDKILQHIDLRGSGVEIGPLHAPIVTREMGRISYVDRAPREELARWFAAHPGIDTATIVDVDHIWGDLTLAECIGPGVRVDYCIASHVMQNVPDPVTWLQEVYAILEDGGILSLALHDQRYSFDCLRPLSTMADLVDAYVNRRRKPSARQIFENFTMTVRADAATLWKTADVASLQLRSEANPRDYLQVCVDARADDTYIDSHCWVLTPASFLELMGRLAELGLLDFEVAAFTDTMENDLEFFVSLRKLPACLSADEKARRFHDSVARFAPAGKVPPSGRVSELEARIAALQTQLALAKGELATMTGSTSWRVTAPLRTFMRLLRGKA